MEQRSLERREKPGLNRAKPTGPNSLEQSLYGLKKGRTLGSIPELLDAATEELDAAYQGTLARPAARPYGPRYCHSNTSGLGEQKGGCFSRKPKTDDSSDKMTPLITAWLNRADAKYNAANASTPFHSCRSTASTEYWSC